LDIYKILWKWIAVFNVLFIALLFVFGVDNGSGNRSWLNFPLLPFSIQPAEVVKITFILLLAMHFAALGDKINHPLSVLSLVAHVGFMAVLIIMSSDDMGMAVVYVFIFIVMALCSRLHFLWLAGGLLATVASLPLLWQFVLKSYQKERIFNIFNPDHDPLKTGWQLAQSKLALQNGGLTGMGLFRGTQTQGKRLPFAHTDFIFSAAGEELGLLGCLLITVLLIAVIVRCLMVSLRARDTRGRLLCAGVAAMLIFQTFENIGMCVGLTPIIGLTLPFFSYGGSSMLTLFISMGLVSGVKMHPATKWYNRG